MSLSESKIKDIINSKCHVDKYLLCANAKNLDSVLENKKLVKKMYLSMVDDIKNSLKIDESVFMKIFVAFRKCTFSDDHEFSKDEITIVLNNDICAFNKIITNCENSNIMEIVELVGHDIVMKKIVTSINSFCSTTSLTLFTTNITNFFRRTKIDAAFKKSTEKKYIILVKTLGICKLILQLMDNNLKINYSGAKINNLEIFAKIMFSVIAHAEVYNHVLQAGKYRCLTINRRQNLLFDIVTSNSSIKKGTFKNLIRSCSEIGDPYRHIGFMTDNIKGFILCKRFVEDFSNINICALQDMLELIKSNSCANSVSTNKYVGNMEYSSANKLKKNSSDETNIAQYIETTLNKSSAIYDEFQKYAFSVAQYNYDYDDDDVLYNYDTNNKKLDDFWEGPCFSILDKVMHNKQVDTNANLSEKNELSKTYTENLTYLLSQTSESFLTVVKNTNMSENILKKIIGTVAIVDNNIINIYKNIFFSHSIYKFVPANMVDLSTFKLAEIEALIQQKLTMSQGETKMLVDFLLVCLKTQTNINCTIETLIMIQKYCEVSDQYISNLKQHKNFAQLNCEKIIKLVDTTNDSHIKIIDLLCPDYVNTLLESMTSKLAQYDTESLFSFDLTEIKEKSTARKINLYNTLLKLFPQKKVASDVDKFICQICLENEIELSFEKCGHVICKTCSQKVSTQCPFCKTRSVHKKLHFC